VTRPTTKEETVSIHEYARREQRWYRVHLYTGEPPVRFKASSPDEAAVRVARIFGAAAVRVELVRTKEVA
jgi:hypothetical protein